MRQQTTEWIAACRRRLALLNEQATYDEWIEFEAIFRKKAPRDLKWALDYIDKLHAYIDDMQKVIESFANPTAALASKTGEPIMRVARGSYPRIDIEPPMRTDDLPKTTMGDAFDLENYEP